MRIRIVLRILGSLLMVLSAAMLLPIPFSLYYGDSDYTSLLISSGISLLAGGLAFINIRRKEDLRPKEGFAVVTLGWLVLSLFGALPFYISGAIPSYTDAFFETISGFTTTGASILTDIEGLPHGLLFWRSLTHWMGGMGIILLSIAILPFLGVGGMQLFKAEVPGPTVDKLAPRIMMTAKILWGVYVLFSAVECLLLMAAGMTFFDALCHTFGTLATGGFSTKNTSLASYDSALIDYIVIIFMIIAGTNFSLHYQALKGNFKAYLRNKEFKIFITIIFAAFVIICMDVFFNDHFGFLETVQYTLFQVISITTTTGYGTADYEKWALTSQVILLFLMFMGGCAGSTGGGMKVMRIYILAKFAYSEIIRLLHPSAVVPIRIGNNIVDKKTISNIAGFFLIHLAITAFGILLMTFLGEDLDTSIGAVAATINNIGPGIGIVGPTENYALIHDAGKWVLSIFMLIGRLEVFTVIVLFAPSFWKK